MNILFEQKYNRTDYLEYLQTFLLPNDFEIAEENVTDRLTFEPAKINDITFLGESVELDLAVYEMQHDSENDPRVTISRDAFKILANFSKRRALVLFAKEGSSNYRLSLITIDLKPEGKKVTKIFSNPRRYSYLLGSDAKLGTLFDKLVKSRKIESTKKVDSFDDLLSRFAVEPVTKEFFNKYKMLYENVIEEFEKSNMFKITIAKTESFNADIFARKLLGQITFLYFLQKKKWLGGDPAKPNNWKDGKQDFLRWGFKKCQNEGINYFDNFLEKLFYEGLNMEGNSFKFNDFFLKVPYLNGGLFECPYQYDELVVFSPDDKLFSNEEETGILDIFDQYNFTIDENTFFEQDIAIDPEMLGKVFENLLDDINRKGKGAFYTPREIVNYMTRESLKQFLITKLQEVDSIQEKLEHLFEYKDLYLNKSDFADNEHEKEFEQQFDELFDIVERIDEFLAKIKIADPAIGSGAFPMGILHEIVSIRSYIKDEFLNEHVSIYALKKETIQNCIYGVDIDNGAIEIAKIRFWLSLVVDAEKPEPLPNFDYKFMQGNSLIESFGGININQVRTKYSDLSNRNIEIDEELSNINSKIEGLQKQFFKEFSETSSQNQELLKESKELDNQKKKLLSEKKKLANELNKSSLLIQEDEIIDHLHFLQERLYFENDKTKKKQFRDEIEDTIVKIFKCRIENEKADYFNAEMKMIETANQLPTKAQRDEYIANQTKELKKQFNFDYDELEAQLHEFTKKDKIRPFFPWHLYFADVFKENNGFDIVIGNPPYVDSETMKKEMGTMRDELRKIYETTSGNWDLYIPFIEKSLLLSNFRQICLIVPNKWLVLPYGKALRKYTLESINLIVDLSEIKVFDAGNTPIIFIVTKDSKPFVNIAKARENHFAKTRISRNLLSINNFGIVLSKHHAIISKLNRFKCTIKDYLSVENPFSTSEAYKLSDIVEEEEKSNNSKKLVVTGTIAKFANLWGLKRTPYLKVKYDFPSVNNDILFEQFKKRYINQINRPKIISKGIRYFDNFLDDEGKFIAGKSTIISMQKDNDILLLKAFLGIYNSKLLFFILKELYSASGIDGGINFSTSMVENIPVPELSSDVINLLSGNVDLIIKNPDEKVLQNLNNIIIYRLYELTYEEIKIVDPDFDKVLSEFGLSAEQYEKMSVEELAELEVTDED